MKRMLVVGLMAVLFLLISGQAFALNSPVVTSEHGVLTGMFVSGSNLILGGEYGLNGQLALIGSLGEPLNRLGVKYELGQSFAVTAGVMKSSPFMGVNGAVGFNRKVQGLYEGAVFMENSNICLFYETGVKIDVHQNIDIRGGLLGFIGRNNSLGLQLGLGYRY